MKKVALIRTAYLSEDEIKSVREFIEDKDWTAVEEMMDGAENEEWYFMENADIIIKEQE